MEELWAHPQRQVFLHILVELIAPSVLTNEDTGLCIAHVLHLVAGLSEANSSQVAKGS